MGGIHYAQIMKQKEIQRDNAMSAASEVNRNNSIETYTDLLLQHRKSSDSRRKLSVQKKANLRDGRRSFQQ